MLTRLPNNPLFARQIPRFGWFLFALLFSFAMMLADHHDRRLMTLRHFFLLGVAPLQLAIDYPVRVIGWGRALISAKKELLDENIALRYQQVLLAAQLQKFMALRTENSELKSLLAAASANAQHRTMAAQILAVDTTGARQVVVLSKGSRDGVVPGQAVLDARGVMGQIIDVGWMTSTLLLISDAKSAVPVLNQRTGERAILVGTQHMTRLALINLPKTSAVLPGDRLVTSGLGGHYPEGYPVGIVDKIQNSTGDDFIQVVVSPVARLNRSRLVLLIWPLAAEYSLSKEIQDRLQAIEGG